MITKQKAVFAFHLSYAVYHGVLGILNRSIWFVVLSAYYFVLAALRLFVFVYWYRKHRVSSTDEVKTMMKFSGILLLSMSMILAGVSYISLSQKIASKYEEIAMITIATYIFLKIILTIKKAVKQYADPSPAFRILQSITYAETAASISTLQRSMLVSFGRVDEKQIYYMNSITGGIVCLFVFILSLSVIVRSVSGPPEDFSYHHTIIKREGKRKMAKSKLVKANEIIAEKVVGTYKKIEDTFVGSYTKIEDAFVDHYLTQEGESVEEAKIRLKKEQKNRES